MDRNRQAFHAFPLNYLSLSARRAWIEIKYVVKDSDFSGVALRKESVDRNNAVQIVVVIVYASLSARRAWIEISKIWYCGTSIGLSLSARRAWIEILALRLADMSGAVALRKESVDRNRISGYLVGVYS